MILIKRDCQDSAVRMLERCGTFLGWIGNLQYWVLDGKAWSIGGGVVCRSDDKDETDRIVRTVKALNYSDSRRIPAIS